MVNFHFYSKADRDNFSLFHDLYQTQGEITCTDKKTKATLPKDQRVCRFCGAKGLKLWKKEAHTFPRFLGNKTLISYDECDKCNQYFSDLETDLAAFLGMSRTINQVNGRGGVPKVKSPKTGVVITGDELWHGEQIVRISLERTDDSNVKIDLENGVCEITIIKETYVPLTAFKVFIKMALAILSSDELAYYGSTKEFLLSNTLDEHWSNACSVNKVTYPLGHGPATPVLWLLKKRNPEIERPMHEVLFFWQNFSFQFMIPFHDWDIKRFAGKPLLSIPVPPFSLESGTSFLSTQEIVRMGIREKVKEEKEVIRFSHGKSDQEVAYDPVTKKLIDKQLDSRDIKGIIITKNRNFRLPIVD